MFKNIEIQHENSRYMYRALINPVVVIVFLYTSSVVLKKKKKDLFLTKI